MSLRHVALAAAIIAVAGAAALAWALPAAAAWACPACYGMTRVAPHLYAGGGTAAERAALPALVTAARARIADFYGAPPPAGTDLLVCLDAACDARLGGRGARGMAYGSAFLRIGPRGTSEVYLAHELSHTALHDRIGLWALVTGKVPAWLDEGIAVIASADPRAPETWGAPCPVAAARLPTGARAWRRAAGRPGADLYRDAACAVGQWLATHGGKPGLFAALGRVRAGSAFPL